MDKHLTPLNISDLNSKNFVGRTEYFDMLMGELKTLMKSKQKESESKSRRLHFSHENVDPEKVWPVPQAKGGTLVRPRLTNPKAFWRTLEDDEAFSSSSKNLKNSYLEEKVITNFFKPIRSEISPEISNAGKGGRGKKKEEFPGKVDKSIHESLRIQKTKRRTSLPFFWNEDFNQELVPAVEKVQTYDFSYYSSILKRINQEKTQYYSSTKKNGAEKSFPMKSASDERIYGEKENKSEREGGSSKSERISVTEPSSPLPGDCFVEVNRKADSSDSEMDSESSGSDVVLEVKKSKSFVDEKEADGYFKTKSRPKTATLGLSKTSQSSTSSCDSAYKARSFRKCPRSKRKNEIGDFEYNQSYVSQSKKYWSGKEVPTTHRKVSDSEVVKRERCQSLNRDVKRDEELLKMKENVFKHLIEALMQKNRSEMTNEKQKELLSKSLPRNTRRWKNDRYEEECLEVLRSVLGQDPTGGKNHQLKSFDRKSKKNSQVENVNLNAGQQRRKMEGDLRDANAQRTSTRNANTERKLNSISETAPKKKNGKGKSKEECVFAIEDKKLWIEICKAVEKVDVKGKMAKKCA